MALEDDLNHALLPTDRLTVAEAEHPVGAAFRAELVKLLAEPLTYSNALRAQRIIKGAVGALNSLSGGLDVAQGMLGELDAPTFSYGGASSMSGLPPMNSETYGTKMVSEAIAAYKEIARLNRETPENIVHAIAAAKDAGLDDVVEKLKEKLTGMMAPAPAPSAEDLS